MYTYDHGRSEARVLRCGTHSASLKGYVATTHPSFYNETLTHGPTCQCVCGANTQADRAQLLLAARAADGRARGVLLPGAVLAVLVHAEAAQVYMAKLAFIVLFENIVFALKGLHAAPPRPC